jgi:Protein of unknown function (DUF2924)
MMSQTTPPEIGGLADLDLPALREHWRDLYGSEPPVRMSRELLIQAIAYCIQERMFGGLSRAARMKLMGLGSGAAEPRRPRIRIQHRIKPGTRLLREWQGQTHEVTTTAEGTFLYRGKAYPSLSEVARQITGTRWSGPAFFGLKQASGTAHVA